MCTDIYKSAWFLPAQYRLFKERKIEAWSNISYQFKRLVIRIRNNDPDVKLFSACGRGNVLSDPHWELIGRYIANNTHLETIEICDKLCDSRASVLFNELAECSRSVLKTITLSGNLFGKTGVQRLVPFLQNCQNLSISTCLVIDI